MKEYTKKWDVQVNANHVHQNALVKIIVWGAIGVAISAQLKRQLRARGKVNVVKMGILQDIHSIVHNLCITCGQEKRTNRTTR